MPVATCHTTTRVCSRGRRFWRAMAKHTLENGHTNGYSTSRARKNVAVVGAGAGGLVAARELLREGHSVTVFEAQDRLGGVWVYTDEREEELGREVFGSMYEGLRTNLPREIMAFSDFPFDAKSMGVRSKDPRRYCRHEEVQEYLELFADVFRLRPHIRLRTRVLEARPLGGDAAARAADPSRLPWPRWHIVSQAESQPGGAAVREDFDALLVCSGHFSRPHMPSLPGAGAFPGRVEHSHSYRTPGRYAGETVVVVGAANSGADISREIAAVAKKVYLCARSFPEGGGGGAGQALEGYPNVFHSTPVVRLGQDGSVHFTDGSSAADVDVVLCATGFIYSYRYLAKGLIEEQGRCVKPLWQHIYPPSAAPTLAFIGIPWMVLPFPQMEQQARLAARVLSGRAHLPPQGVMEEEVRAHFRSLAERGIDERFAHRMGDEQWAYNAALSELCGGGDTAPSWQVDMFLVSRSRRRTNQSFYRDVPWDDQADLLRRQQAHAEECRHRVAAPTA